MSDDQLVIGEERQEVREYYDLAKQLHEWNYYASAWHMFLFAMPEFNE